MGGILATIMVCAFWFGAGEISWLRVLGLVVAVGILAVRALRIDANNVEAMEGANKNSYSLFALPMILLAGYIVLNLKNIPKVIKGVLIACSIVSLAAIFLSANRSGYLGAVFVAVMLFWKRRTTGLLLVGLVAITVAYGVVRFGSTAVFDERMRQTVKGNDSDNLRRDIFFACLQIGLENPLIGVSPQRIPRKSAGIFPSIFNGHASSTRTTCLVTSSAPAA